MAAGDATAAVVPSVWAGGPEAEQAVAAAIVVPASKPPAIRIPIMIGLLFSLP
ncbi:MULTISPECIES: hypothetical protein [unclassified Streptomyces]|uniref:hypothetical protein n=1 Tax=unclassified Streptomyces TaxID=2593676 RepID=UPI004042B0A0